MSVPLDSRQSQALQWAAVIAIIVALIGLYGLLGLVIAQRFDDFRNQVMSHAVIIVGLAEWAWPPR